MRSRDDTELQGQVKACWLSCVPVELRSRSSAGTCSTSDLQIAIFGMLFLEYASTSQGASLHGLVECAHVESRRDMKILRRAARASTETNACLRACMTAI